MACLYQEHAQHTIKWLSETKRDSQQTCVAIPWDRMLSWKITEGAIRHRNDRFFSVIGVRAFSNKPPLDGCEQPIIHQPEIGILGFLVRQDTDQISLLLQAKAEPGNVDDVQIAPSVQATVSNYTRAHGGAPTPYLDHFQNPGSRIISDSLQSEQGSRFLNKYNRNIVVEVDEPIPAPIAPNWMWCPWETLRYLLSMDFKINTDARSVLASSDWNRLTVDRPPFDRRVHTGDFGEKLRVSFQECPDSETEKTLQQLESWREASRFSLELRPLDKLKDWRIDAWRMTSNSAAFQVRAFKVRVNYREVPAWDQPLIHTTKRGAIYLICQGKKGILRFLLRTRVEIGFAEYAQLGPSLQIEDHRIPLADPLDQHLAALVRQKRLSKTHLTCLQSDEGGRFYRSISRYSIIELPEHLDFPTDESSCWLSLGQIHRLSKIQGVMTNEVRSLISLLLYYL